MSNVDIFESFAADFEDAVADDHWLRLEKYFAVDATYLNLGGPDPKCVSRDAILTYFKQDVTNTDRKFDTRTLVAVSPPLIEGEHGLESDKGTDVGHHAGGIGLVHGDRGVSHRDLELPLTDRFNRELGAR